MKVRGELLLALEMVMVFDHLCRIENAKRDDFICCSSTVLNYAAMDVLVVVGIAQP